MLNITLQGFKSAFSWHRPIEDVHVPTTLFEKVSKSRPWRHTLGRASCAVRLPFHFLTALGLVVKVGVKTVSLPITCFIPGDSCGPWTVEGFQKDVVMLKDKIDRMFDSMVAFVIAPDRNYRSLPHSIRGDIKILLGEHQEKVVLKGGIIFECPQKTAEEFEKVIQGTRQRQNTAKYSLSGQSVTTC